MPPKPRAAQDSAFPNPPCLVKRPQPAFRSTMLSSLIMLLLSGIAVGEQPLTAGEWMSTAQRARDANAQHLNSLRATGRLLREVSDPSRGMPRTTLDAQLQLAYDGPNFHLSLNYLEHLIRVSGDFAHAWRPSNIARRNIIFDSKTVTLVEWTVEGECRGELFYDFGLQQAMRTADFPAEDPIQLWTPALSLAASQMRNTEITPLAGGGVVGQVDNPHYRMRFYFFGSFDYDLRRVSTYRKDDIVPFRDIVLNWKAIDDAWFVQRYVATLRTNNAADEPLQGDVETTIVEYQTMEKIAKLPLDIFSLRSLDIPRDAIFRDHRQLVDGRQKLWRWDGDCLVEVE